jgi:PhnB protein
LRRATDPARSDPVFAVLGRRRPRRPLLPGGVDGGSRTDAAPCLPFEQETPTMKIHPYLMFPGTAREAFAFYAQALGGTVTATMTYGDSPEGETPEPYRDWIMHTCLNIGEEMLMGSDHAPFCPGPAYEGISGNTVSLQIDDPAEARRVFEALSIEAKAIQMPLAATFWAQLFGMCTDRFGVPWMINCPTPQELQDCGPG